MTERTDLDGKLRAWLDLMPDEAPDHAIAAVLDAIDATPQPRSARWWPSWRTPMNRSLAAFAAAMAIVVVGAALLLGPGFSSRVATVPSASAGPSTVGSPQAVVPSAALGALPSQLQGRWMGGNSPYVAAGAGSSLLLGPDRFTIAQSNLNDQPTLLGTIGTQGDGLRLTSDPNTTGCQDTDVGIYSWSVSASGRVLTLSAVREDCARREAAIAGTWWLMGCKDTTADCLGTLDAGTYETQYFTPFLDSALPWSPPFGAVTYTVPAGWANSGDWPGSFGLSTSPDDGATTGLHVVPPGAIDLFAQAAAEGSPCSGAPDASVPVSATAIAHALRGDAGLIVGPASPVTIDGRDGISVDLAVDASKAGGCPTIRPIVEYLIGGGIGQSIGSGEHERLILLDYRPGNVLAIRLHVNRGVDFNAFAAAAMPIVQSMTFR
jgi:hypothetical protein